MIISFHPIDSISIRWYAGSELGADIGPKVGNEPLSPRTFERYEVIRAVVIGDSVCYNSVELSDYL